MPTPSVIDISHHNDLVDPGKLRAAGIQGVIMKCTQGTRYVDPTWAPRVKALAGAFCIGAYHFATSDDPEAQVNWFLGHAQPDPNMLLALDWEQNPDGPDMSAAQARAFLDSLMAKTGRSPHGIVVYGGSILKEQIKTAADLAYFGQFPLWLAQYGAKPVLPRAWSTCFLWQYSETGKIDGMAPDGSVDLNAYFGSSLEADWVTEAAIIAAAQPIPVPAPRSDPDPVIGNNVTATVAVRAAASSKPVKGILGGLALLVGDAVQRVEDGFNWLFQQMPSISDQTQKLMAPFHSVFSIIGEHAHQLEWIAGGACFLYAIMHAASHELPKGTT